MADNNEIIITLEFDDGESVECTPLFVFDCEDQDYIALVPLDEESDDVYLYEYHELENDEFEFSDIKDDDVFERVSAAFEECLDEYEEEEDEED